jgi:hypothetical protein
VGFLAELVHHVGRYRYCPYPDDTGDACDRDVTATVGLAGTLLTVEIVALAGVVVAAVLVGRGRGAGRGVAWAVLATFLVYRVVVAIGVSARGVSGGPYDRSDPATWIAVLEVAGQIVVLVALLAAAPLLAAPSVRRHVVGRARRPLRPALVAGLLAAAARLALATVAVNAGTAAAGLWGAVDEIDRATGWILLSVLTSLGGLATVTAGVATVEARRTWARRLATLGAGAGLAVAAPAAMAAIVVLVATDEPTLVVTSLVAAVAGLAQVVVTIVAVVLLTDSSALRAERASGPGGAAEVSTTSAGPGSAAPRS